MTKQKTRRHSKAESDLLTAARAIQQERKKANNEELQVQARFMARHQRAANVFHQKVVDRAFRAAGIDKAQLDERHKRERESVLRFLAARKREALRQTARTNRIHQTYFAEMVSRRKLFLAPPGPPPAPTASPEFTLLTSASSIDLNAQTGTFSIAPQQNIVQTKVEEWGWVSAVVWDLRADLASIGWNFLWQPSRDGMLNVISALSMNGWGGAYPGPGCDKGNAYWKLTAGITLTQLGTTGTPLTDEVQNKVDEESFGHDELPSTGGVIFTGKRLDGVENLIFDKSFPVIQQNPLLITVTAGLYAQVSHGEAELNFMDRGAQLNVPYVFLALF